MKRKSAIIAALFILIALGITGFSGCTQTPSGEAKVDINEGMYDVSLFYVHKNPKTGEESYYFLVSANEGELRAIRVPKSSVKERKTRQSSYVSVRKGNITFFRHDEALAKPNISGEDAYDKRFTPPSPSPSPPAPQPVAPPPSPEATQPSGENSSEEEVVQ
ncbi:MAG: hypothetical protein M1548_10560 [Actinobacteria bacterium]|nr:hypothetical protein [Actinomycetota bacterium]